MGSVPNMVRSIVVVLAMVAVVYFMVPRTSSVERPPVDVTTNAVAVAGETGWPVVAPEGLPDGWRATAARFDRTRLGLPTWFVGYETPSGAYVALTQAADVTPDWLAGQTDKGARTGQRTVGGQTWDEYARADGTQNSLVRAGTGTGAVTTVLSGTAGFAEIAELAGHLRVVAGDGSATPSPSASTGS